MMRQYCHRPCKTVTTSSNTYPYLLSPLLSFHLYTGNDLDLSTLTALEEYLTEVFDGCLVVVSHDNFFVNRVAEHLFVFEGDGVVRDFEGEEFVLSTSLLDLFNGYER